MKHPEDNMDDPTGSGLVMQAYHGVALTIPQWEAGAGAAAQAAAVIRAATDRILPASPKPSDATPRSEWAIRNEVRQMYMAMVGVLEAHHPL